MKFTRSTISQLCAMAALAASGAAFAAGNHAGGHGDEGETAIGKPGVAAKARRTITIEMSDNMRYTPSNIQVKQGETVRFVVKNVGQVKHELSLGTEKELLEHLEQMKKFPDMEHDAPHMAHVKPGASGEIVWNFNRAGTFEFACLAPRHFEAGMLAVSYTNLPLPKRYTV